MSCQGGWDGGGMGIRLSGEVISRCEALAGREDIIRAQGQADKEAPHNHISIWSEAL